MYNFIINPKTHRKVNIFGNIGQKILQNYINQLGGHNGPCSLNTVSGRCKKSKKTDGNCKVSAKGRCQKIKNIPIQKANVQEPALVVEKKQVPLEDDILANVNADELIEIGEAKMDTNSYEYLRIHNPKALKIKWRKARLHSVLFNGPVNGPSKYGDVDYFENILKQELGNNWSKRVLDINESLEDVENISRLGIPGKQGTVIRLDLPGQSYAVKVTEKGVACGDGASGFMGFLKQAKMQEIAANFGITGHVYAVFCGKKKLPSFMVMDLMGQRVVDVYGRKTGLLEMSQLHQQQLWDLYKTLDEKVGILHNDNNCLNLMIDHDGNLKLIDFDRSVLIEDKHLKKYGSFPNLNFSAMVAFAFGCKSYGIKFPHYTQIANEFFSDPNNNNGTSKFRLLRL